MLRPIKSAFLQTVSEYRDGGYRHPSALALMEYVGVPLVIALLMAALAGCGSAQTPRELYDTPTACRSVNGGCNAT